MPRKFEVNLASDVGVEQVWAAFRSKKYWQERTAALGDIKIDKFTAAEDGPVAVQTTENLKGSNLPSVLAAVLPGSLNLVTTEDWKSVGDGTYTGDIALATTGAPGSGTATGVLAPVGDGSRLTVNGSVRFNMPLVGGKIEEAIIKEFEKTLSSIQEFTNTWVAQNNA